MYKPLYSRHHIKNNLFYPFVIIMILLTAIFTDSCRRPEETHKKVAGIAFSGDRSSQIFHVTIEGVPVPVTVVPNVDPAESKHIVEQYKKLPEYCWIEPRYVTVHYVHFAIDTVAKVRLTVSEPVKKYIIYPKRTGLKAVVKDSTLVFTIDRRLSRYYLVSVNRLPMFAILTEALKQETPEKNGAEVVSLTSFVKDGPVRDYTEVFHRAISAVNGTGKTLVIPPGEYLTGTIEIKGGHDFNIYMSSGSLIKIKTSPPAKNIPAAGLVIRNSRNIRVYGMGCLDHQAYENFHDGRNDYHHGFPGYDFYFTFRDIYPTSIYLQSPLLILYSQDITVEGLLIRNGRNYNINSRHSDNITLRNVKVITPAGSVPENTDGINIGSYRNFLVEDAFIYCNDDCFSMGHNLLPYDNRGADGLVIRNMVGWNPRANAVRLGWACNTYAGDMLFEGCDFSGMDDCAMQLHHHTSTGKEALDSLAYGTVSFVNCTFDDVNRYTMPFLEIQHTAMKGLEYVNVTFDTVPPVRARIFGDSLRKISHLVIDNMRLGKVKMTVANVKDYMDIRNTGEVIMK